MSYKIAWDSLHNILARRGLENGGKVQQFIGNEVARLSDKRVPLRSGVLKNTVKVLNDGKEVVYNQPYASYQYYSTPQSRGYDPIRGSYWFERTKNAEGKQIIEAAARMAGGRT